jgi:GT2 family glycosyltransferase
MPRLFAILITHTHERIARSVMSVASQTRAPDAIVVACDGESPRIHAEIARAADRVGRPVLLVTRPHTGEARPAQTRNNAVRALMDRHGLADDDRLVFLDGDCLAMPKVLHEHDRALEHHHLCLGWRIELDETQTARLTDEDAISGRITELPGPDQLAELSCAARSHRRRALMRACSLTKPHKPQVLGANFGILGWVFRAVNGLDETFTAWGMEDDDFGRRVYALGGRFALRLRSCVVLHQHHPTRARGAWIDNPHARRLDLPFRIACDHGLTNPLPQPAVSVTLVHPGVPGPEMKPARVEQAGLV